MEEAWCVEDGRLLAYAEGRKLKMMTHDQYGSAVMV